MNTQQGWRSSRGGTTPVDDKNYVHQQTVASIVWSVPHNLNKKCAVQITDDNEVQIFGGIRWVNDDEVEITFNTPKTGYVFCN